MHFSITGAGFTRIVRDLMLSEEPGEAERLIVVGLRGEGGRTAHAWVDGLCLGTHRLVGDESGMDVELDDGSSEDTQRYLQDLRYIYAGRVRVDRRWWRPRAWVSSFGQEDARHAVKVTGRGVPADLPGNVRRLRAFGMARVAHYAFREERVFDVGAVRLRGCEGGERAPGYAIFEPVGDGPPRGWPVNLTPEAALVEALAVGRRLDEEAHSRRYPSPDLPTGPRRAAPMKTDCDAAEAEAAREEAAHQARLSDVRRRVLEQAAGDTFELVLNAGSPGARNLTVPRAPFWHWALSGGPKRGGALRHLAPLWEPVAESGWKLPGDDRYHTDWLVGAGLDPGSGVAYRDDVRDASWREAWALQERLGKFECGVVVDAGPVRGVVGIDVVVVPDLDPRRLPDVAGARGIITERGGAVAHLAQVGRERGVTIVRVEDAVARYARGSTVTLLPAEGRVEVDMYAGVQEG